jgi:hypothetical protein
VTVAARDRPADAVPDTAARRFRAGVLLAAVVGLVVRLVYVLVVDPEIPGVSDAAWYHGVANALADGQGYVHPFLLDRPTADFPPLLPLLLTPFSIVGLDSVRAHQLVLVPLGTVTIVVVGLLGRRFAGARVGLVAAGIAAVYPPLWQLDGSLMAETPFVLLVSSALLATLRAVERPTPARAAVVGGLLGLAVLTRSDGAALVPLLAVPLAWGARRVGGRRAVEVLVAVGAACVVVMLPWTVRNLITMDDLVLGGNNSGGAIAGSNCDSTYHGDGTGLWDITCIFQANDRDPVERDENERAAYLRRAGASYARHHLGDLPRVGAVRFLRAWGLYPTESQFAYETAESRDHGVVVLAHRCYLVVAGAAIGGLVVARRRRITVWPLVVGALAVTGSALATYGNQRFRAGFEPSIVVLAALGAVALVDRVRGRPAEGQWLDGAIVDGVVAGAVVDDDAARRAESLHGAGGSTSPASTAGSTAQLPAGES